MQRKPLDQELAGHNIMAAILQNLPSEAELTKIEYEGPRIALYSKNPGYLLKNAQVVSNMVNTIKKRIVIRIDESLRIPEHEAFELITKTLPTNIGVAKIFFDPALGEATIYAVRPSLISKTNDEFVNLDLAERTGWKVEIRKAPHTTSTIEEINKILHETATQRIHFYKEVGEKIFRVKLDDIVEASLITLGGFAEVGRSAIVLSTHESKILLDCGINISSKESIRSFPRFDITGFDLNELDAIVLSHGHLDHTGFLPALFKFGYAGPVYCSEPTLPLTYLLQREYLKNIGPAAPYSVSDIEQVVVHSIPLSFGIVTDISPDVKLMLSNAGHIIGSALIHLHIGNGDHNLLYTGDLKFGKSYSLDNAIWNFPRVETIIIESTYGDKQDIFPQREEANKYLIESINDTVVEGGKILFPVPSVGLAQELILIIHMHMKSGKIDNTKMLIEKVISEASSIYEVFPEYLSREMNHRVLDTEEAPFYEDEFKLVESVGLDNGPAMIFSPSSMLVGGPSVGYLRQISEDPRNKLILTSYQAAGTPGRFIQEGGRDISVCGQTFSIACRVQKIEGFSSHSDYNQSVAYINRLKPKLRKILVNHGERASVQNLASSLNKIFKIPTQHPLVQEAIKLM
ncbi:MAG TPA: beta-CASP ribonuclease aCPSF1 [Candidatus Nitrosopolaris sp.]|nr:beta-CASP ribonuclease aCPSF1 [Candidatus Nitrosopolaris sp.]